MPDIVHFELSVAVDSDGDLLAYVVTDEPPFPTPPGWEDWTHPEYGETPGHNWLVPDRILDQMTRPYHGMARQEAPCT